ncbi:ATP-binding protein [Pseudodesulfovibrio sp.]|uniref:hybrid sensor histidine kinase/response regulator n=1 Tax=unclassified Pseudodesulfovibrio TaxID=2661612 RepID=UPI003B007045
MRILLLMGKNVDGDRAVSLLGGRHCESAQYGALSRGVRCLEQSPVDVTVLVPDAGDESWLRAMERIRVEHGVEVVALLPDEDAVRTAVEAGAFDAFVLDRIGPGDLDRSFRHLARVRNLQNSLDGIRNLYEWVEETAWMGAWEADAEGRTTWSRGARRILGDVDGGLGLDFQTIRRFVHPDDIEIFEQANKATFEQGWPLDFEYRVRAGDGVRHLHLHRRVEHGPGGEVVRAYGMLRDVTPEREFEDVLFRRDAVLQVVGACAAGYLREANGEKKMEEWLADLGRAMDVSRAYVFRMPSAGEGGILGEWALDGLSPLKESPGVPEEPAAILYKRLLPLLLGRKAVACHARDLHAEEREYLQRTGVRSLMLIPVFADGGWWGLIGLSEHRRERDWLPAEIEAMTMMADILGSAVLRGRMEGKLKAANRRAEEASRAKSRFLANMSHEVRTPIGGILGMAGMLVSMDLPPDLREHVNMIHDAARSLLDIVNDVLDLSRVEASRLELEPSDFNLQVMLERTVAPLAAEARGRGLEFNLDIAGGIEDMLNGDASRLAQVIRNLVSNALKFTLNGYVRVGVALHSEGPDGQCLRFTVSDSGEGIPAEMQPTIFDAFVQGDSSVRKRHQGTGLGLAICRELVSLMGGGISVESETGRGSTFIFTARFARARGVRAGKMGTPDCSSARSLHLLLVEDNPLNQRFMTQFLGQAGYRVTVAGNGRQGLEALRRHGRSLDMVLMDIQMPEMDGLEATACIRSGDGRAFDPSIPIIALTAYAMKGDRDRMIEAGMDGYVSKPVEMEVLFRAMDRAMHGRPCLDDQSELSDSAPAPRPDIAPAGAAGGGYDLDALVSRYRGDIGLLREILVLFLGEAGQKLLQLDRGLADGDVEAVGAAAHSIANLGSHVLAMELVHEARSLERQCLRNGVNAVREPLAALREAFRSLVGVVRNYAESL